jgi:hypothetical protein
MALILYRVMRMRLRASDTQLSPERALDRLRRIQHHQVIVNNTQPVTGDRTLHHQSGTHRHSGGADDQKTNAKHPIDSPVMARLAGVTI